MHACLRWRGLIQTHTRSRSDFNLAANKGGVHSAGKMARLFVIGAAQHRLRVSAGGAPEGG